MASLSSPSGKNLPENFQNKPERGLYIHIPFCVKKCAYCDFYSFPQRLDSLDSYLEAVLIEATKYRGISFDSLYLGGGTPSLLGGEGLSRLLNGLHYIFDLTLLSEATMEANPESVNFPLLEAAQISGINRISIGIQSLSDDELEKAGRVHNAIEAVQAIEMAKEKGFLNISADVILGLPGQNWDSLMVTLETLIGLNIQHFSVYCLSIEPHTPFGMKTPIDLPGDDEQAELYTRACALLSQRGFIHYEISNFALPGYECRHNLNYWRGGEYLGLGPAGASHLEGKRFKNQSDLDAYLHNPLELIEGEELLEAQAKAAEEAMLRLRLLREGLDMAVLTRRFGDENTRQLKERLNKLVEKELLLADGTAYRLPPACALISNPILSRVLGD
jgi:putative oxygen-independent coproporphyrinogen III oxidase